MLEQDGEALLYTVNRRESLCVSSLLDQEGGEPCCILPVGACCILPVVAGGKALLYSLPSAACCILPSMLEQEGEALLYTPCRKLEQKGEPRCILPVGVGGIALLYPPCWSRRDSPAVSSLLEQEGEPCCILPVGSGVRDLLYPPCWSIRKRPAVSFPIGAGGTAMLHPPCWSQLYPPCWSSRGALLYPLYFSWRVGPAGTFLLEHKRETCCILPVGAGGKALLYPACWSRRESPFFIFPVV